MPCSLHVDVVLRSVAPKLRATTAQAPPGGTAQTVTEVEVEVEGEVEVEVEVEVEEYECEYDWVEMVDSAPGGVDAAWGWLSSAPFAILVGWLISFVSIWWVFTATGLTHEVTGVIYD